MLDIYLDPIVFGCQANASADCIADYAKKILSLHSAIDCKGIRLLVSGDTSDVLVRTNSYPYYESFERLGHVQRADVVALVNSLLTKGKRSEDILGVREILIEDAKCSPDSHLIDRQAEFTLAHFRLVSLMALHKIMLQSRTNDSFIGSEPLMLTRRGQEKYTLVHFQGVICDGELISGEALRDIPIVYSENFHILENFSEIPLCITTERLVSDYDAFKQAVDYTVWQTNNLGGVCEWPPPSSDWKAGADFLDSARHHGFLHEAGKTRSLLRAMAETINGVQLSDTHALRKNAGGNSTQRSRQKDNALAWRRDIDREYHLHYWQTSQGPEFALVVTHNDFSIPT